VGCLRGSRSREALESQPSSWRLDQPDVGSANCRNHLEKSVVSVGVIVLEVGRRFPTCETGVDLACGVWQRGATIFVLVEICARSIDKFGGVRNLANIAVYRFLRARTVK
jgi:hypothetical protein